MALGVLCFRGLPPTVALPVSMRDGGITIMLPWPPPMAACTCQPDGSLLSAMEKKQCLWVTLAVRARLEEDSECVVCSILMSSDATVRGGSGDGRGSAGCVGMLRFGIVFDEPHCYITATWICLQAATGSD